LHGARRRPRAVHVAHGELSARHACAARPAQRVGRHARRGVDTRVWRHPRRQRCRGRGLAQRRRRRDQARRRLIRRRRRPRRQPCVGDRRRGTAHRNAMKSLTARATRAVPAGHVQGHRTSLPLMLLRDVGLPLLLTRLLLVLVTLTAPRWRWTVPDPGRFLSPAPPVGGALLSRWYHWDAAWYLRIAGNGPQMGYSHYTA